MEDLYGCSLSTQNPEVIPYVNQFCSELVLMGKKINSILSAVQKYPDEFILQLYAAIFYLYEQTESDQQKAIDHLNKAAPLLDRANEREKSLYSFALSWANQRLSEALKNIERHCYKWPKDLTAIKITEFLFYCKGQKYESKRFLRLTSHCFHEHKDNPFFLAIHSFALELSTKYDESFQIVQRALNINEENPWAHHTLSHLFINRGHIDEGIQVLERYSQLWDKFNRQIESHNFWHLALLYLENLDFEKVDGVIRRAEWAHQAPLVGAEIDASALLWRLDMEGEEHLNDWKKLAESIKDHANFGGTPFISAQLFYALKRGNRNDALAEGLQKIENFSLEQQKEDRFVWKEVGLPLIYGSLAFADGDYAQALTYFDPIIDKVACVGGSDAQVDLFYQTYLKSLIGGHRPGDAEKLLHKMTQSRDLTKLERKWLAECQKS